MGNTFCTNLEKCLKHPNTNIDKFITNTYLRLYYIKSFFKSLLNPVEPAPEDKFTRITPSVLPTGFNKLGSDPNRLWRSLSEFNLLQAIYNRNQISRKKSLLLSATPSWKFVLYYSFNSFVIYSYNTIYKPLFCWWFGNRFNKNNKK